MTVHNGGAGFRFCTGEEPAELWGDEDRARHLEAAVEGLRQMRRVTNVGPEPEATPAEWERLQPLRAVSLLLEAGKIVPAAIDSCGEVTRTGYRTSLLPDRCVCVRWDGPRGSGARYEEREQLALCEAVLRRWGFEVLTVKGPGRRWYLEVEPRPRGC